MATGFSPQNDVTHAARVRELVAVGRNAASADPQAAGAIRDLATRDNPFERLQSLLSAYGSRDGAQIVRALDDPSRTVRRHAARLLPKLCNDGEVADGLSRIVERRVLVRTVANLRRRRRENPIDAFLSGDRAELSDALRADLLPYASASCVQESLSLIQRSAGPAGIRRLAWYHPQLLLSWLDRQARAGGGVDQRTRFLLYPSLAIVAKRDPDATLAAVRELWGLGVDINELGAALHVLVRKRPAATFDLLRHVWESGRPARPPGAFGMVRFDKVAHRLGPERLDFIIRHAWSTLADGKRGPRWFLRLVTEDQKAVLRAFIDGGCGGWGAFLFRYLRNSETGAQLRDRAFDRWVRQAKDIHGVIPVAKLEDLPAYLREREARRHLFDCRALASSPERRIAYASLLSFASAVEVLKPFLGHHEGEQRAAAQSHLIATAKRDRDAIGDVLASIAARRFEQDPVRRAMLQALASLPIACFTSAHLESVGELLQHGLDAADLSHATAAVMQLLVARLFRIDGAWGARWMVKMLEVRGSISMWGLGDNLTRDEALRLSPHVAELARLWATRENAGSIITLAHSLGIRLGVVDPLLDALERLASELPFVGVADASLSLIRKHDRHRFRRLVPELLREDRSFALLRLVARLVSLERQDLLDSLLKDEPMTGRFATGRSHWVIDFEVGHGRWTRSQQETYSKGLDGLLEEPSRDVPTLRFALRTLARLAFADPAILIGRASDSRPPVREMAIRALPWLDSKQGVPVLIEALGDDRARWAIYALRKVFAEMRPAEVLGLLRDVPTSKVTVAKEVVRLLGEIDGDDAYRTLLSMHGPGVHRDIRIAILRALWDHLERGETWSIFEEAVADPDWIVASKLADVPLHRLSDDAESKVVALLARILARPEPEARLDLLSRAAWLPLRDSDRALLRRLVAHMGTDSPEEAGKALEAVLNRMSPGETKDVVDAVGALLERRRRLLCFVDVIGKRIGPYAARNHVEVARGVESQLRRDDLAIPLYLRLAGKLQGHAELAETFEDLSRRGLLHHDAMIEALNAVRESVHPVQLEVKLREHGDPAVRRLGLEALKEAASPKKGWTKERREILKRYRDDESPAVAGPAAFVFPPS